MRRDIRYARERRVALAMLINVDFAARVWYNILVENNSIPAVILSRLDHL